MNWSTIERNWYLFLPLIQESWEALSETDLLMVDGDRDLLIAMIGHRYDLPPEIAERRVSLFERGTGFFDPPACEAENTAGTP